jgi:hypothetical protein
MIKPFSNVGDSRRENLKSQTVRIFLSILTSDLKPSPTFAK